MKRCKKVSAHSNFVERIQLAGILHFQLCFTLAIACGTTHVEHSTGIPPPSSSFLTLPCPCAADIISAVEFDYSGDYLATGDHGGRVVIFERVARRPPSIHPDLRPPGADQITPYDFRYLTEFQSHDAEFDYLKSLEIEEKINRIRWLRPWAGTNNSMSVLTTNDKTVKLWKVYEKKLTCLSEFNLQNGSSTLNRIATASPDKLAAAAIAGRPRAADVLRVPKIVSKETVLASKCRKVYSAAHTYHIHSISLSADQETFLSSDDLRINLWHLDRPDTSFNVVDIKPVSMEDLTEVITAADFSTQDSSLFAFASSKGTIRLADLREAALCDGHAKVFEVQENGQAGRTFFTEIISSVNDIRFVPPDGRYLISRDYMTMRLWDIRYESQPVATYPVQEPLRNRFADLYESDAIFDKFDVTCSGNGSYFATGTYGGFFRVVPQSGGGVAAGECLLEASRDPARRRLTPSHNFGGNCGGAGGNTTSNKAPSRFVGFGRSAANAAGARSKGNNNSSNQSAQLTNTQTSPTMAAQAALASAEESMAQDLNAKVQHLSWHPNLNIVATANANSLWLVFGRERGAAG